MLIDFLPDLIRFVNILQIKACLNNFAIKHI